MLTCMWKSIQVIHYVQPSIEAHTSRQKSFRERAVDSRTVIIIMNDLPMNHEFKSLPVFAIVNASRLNNTTVFEETEKSIWRLLQDVC